MHALIHPLLILFAKFPKLGGLFGLLVAIAFGYLGVASWNSLQKMPQNPTHATLEQAALLVNDDKDAWIEIEKVKWDCQNIVPEGGSDGRTEVVFTNDTASVLGVAIFSKSDLSCKDLSESNVSGILSQMGDTFYERLPKRGFNIEQYKYASIRLGLCTFCGRSNSALLVILGIVFTILGLAMYPISLSMSNYYKKKGLL